MPTVGANDTCFIGRYDTEIVVFYNACGNYYQNFVQIYSCISLVQ